MVYLNFFPEISAADKFILRRCVKRTTWDVLHILEVGYIKETNVP